MKDLETYIDEAIKNIRSDRAITTALLMELMDYMKKDDDRKETVGTIAAKYVETLQRSNEQLVKVSTLIQKKSGADQSLSEEDKSELFDLIKESGNG
jgi:metal-responsive CopG/Arc/MetJ family transcriptional regulator